jgi:hypothetical protein
MPIIFSNYKLKIHQNHADKMRMGVGSRGEAPYICVTSAANGSEWSASRFGCFKPNEDPAVPTG